MSAGRRLVGGVLGLGRLPAAPGTWASLATVVVVALLFGVAGAGPGPLAGGDPWAARLAVAGVAAVLLALGIAVGNHAAHDWGREDPGSFVLDEVVGQMLALLPVLPGPLSWPRALLAFVLFRIFDVLKPPPCRRLESLPGGLGIMADDVAAGAFAAAVMCGLAAVGWPPA